MSTNIAVYGSTDPIGFTFSLDNEGVDPTLVLGDVKMSKDFGTVTNVPLSQLTPVDAANMPGAYKFAPTTSDLSCKTLMVKLKDQVGAAFDENLLIIDTGGNASARFAG